MAANSRARQLAYDKCAVRVDCLIEWHALARAAVYSNVEMRETVCGATDDPAK